ncbi:MAG: nucleoside kinase [Lachnospiraceae bacterium]|nr:nucleoside kinase [bacterium]MDY5518535.1 nucleoside kinase [Lachnospiraceae bacterium]
MSRIMIDGNEVKYEQGTTFEQIAKDYQKNYEQQIVLVFFNGRLRELNKTVKEDGRISFVTVADKPGVKAYRRTVVLLMQKALDDLYGEKGVGVRVLQTTGNGQYCELTGTDMEATDELLQELGVQMHRLIEADLPINKENHSTAGAVKLFHELGMTDKEKLFGYRRSSRVNIYELGGYRDYFYGYMLPSTGYVNNFDLVRYSNGFVLLYPDAKTGVVSEYHPSDKLFATQRESSLWGEKMGVKNIGELNEAIATGRIQDIILMQEAQMESRIGELADMIANAGNKKFIMIAGPSSSGKTTFSHRLSIHLSALGLKPHPIPLDDYYLDRDKTPRDENGNYDFECLEALDVELFNKDMSALLAGERVELPIFNFKTGKREYRGKYMQLGPEDILVIEGIHGLNDKLSYSLPGESKFKIYISALTQLAVDEHNALPTTDGRLIRRIVRDARTRNTSAQETIAMWDSVRRGEEKYIFPFQEEADYIFNSALLYELAVLKIYAEPLLFNIPKDAPEYVEAKRLLKFLDYFLAVPSENIHHNSLVREFIGGSCFNV